LLILLTLDNPLLQIVAAPPSLAITSLHVSHQMSYSISQASALTLAHVTVPLQCCVTNWTVSSSCTQLPEVGKLEWPITLVIAIKDELVTLIFNPFCRLACRR
jgi:hypothetical protein